MNKITIFFFTDETTKHVLYSETPTVPTIRNATYEARAHSYLLKKGRPE
jgi:hypothetical protein